jgi:hypothetical protein
VIAPLTIEGAPSNFQGARIPVPCIVIDPTQIAEEALSSGSAVELVSGDGKPDAVLGGPHSRARALQRQQLLALGQGFCPWVLPEWSKQCKHVCETSARLCLHEFRNSANAAAQHDLRCLEPRL